MNEFFRTDTAEDLVATLELACEFLAKSYGDGRYWKWFIHSMHSAAQSTAALALEKGNGFLVQKPKVMQRMLEAHVSGTKAVDPHMDNFIRLIEKVLDKENLRDSAEPFQDRGHLESLKALDELRDGFAHFNVKSWSIETLLILDSASKALEFIDHYLCATQAVLWHDEQHRQRAITAIGTLQTKLHIPIHTQGATPCSSPPPPPSKDARSPNTAAS